MPKKVFVSGCFDMLHSGHVAFFKEAATYGEVFVGLGSDNTITDLKGRKPVNSENERLFMVQSIRFIKDAWINKGSGLLDFKKELIKLKPDIFFVNEEGFTPDKQKLCSEKGIQLIVSKRMPIQGLPPRSTTALRNECRIPYRLDLAGGWLDQPYVSKYYPGPVLTISISPDNEYNYRSGMASSTREKAMQLWKTDIPEGDKELLAKTLFSFENPPGTKIISGSQDSIGIVYPGVNRLNYKKGEYWPEKIETCLDKNIIDFIENHLYFITLSPRIGDFDVLSNTEINTPNAKALADAANNCWEAIFKRELKLFGHSFRKSFEAQIKMFPGMVNNDIHQQLDFYSRTAIGWKLSGAGGGGYLVLVSEKPIPNASKIKIVRA